jgi:hypothetical protein
MHQDREPSEICKTSIPGSNPGGGSKILSKSANIARGERDRMRSKPVCLDLSDPLKN